MQIPARLLLTRRFAPFFAVLLTGAYNDNVLRNALAVLVTYQIASYAGLDSGALVAAAAGVFILPFFLFSATGGALADRYPRHRLVRAVKLAEMLLMALAWLGFAWNSLGLLFAVLFLTGLQSALFGPVKYAILPNLLERGELLGGNAWVAAGTFAAILAGTLTGTLLMAAPDARAWVPGVLLASAGFGYACSRFVPAQAPGHPDLEVSWNPLRETARILRQGLAEPGLPGVMLAISWFWMIGAGVLVQLPVYMRDTLAGNEQALGGVLAVFTIGVALGALLCGALARGRDAQLKRYRKLKRATRIRRADLYALFWTKAVAEKVHAIAKPGEDVIGRWLEAQGRATHTVDARPATFRPRDEGAAMDGWRDGRNAQLYRGVDGAEQGRIGHG